MVILVFFASFPHFIVMPDLIGHLKMTVFVMPDLIGHLLPPAGKIAGRGQQ